MNGPQAENLTDPVGKVLHVYCSTTNKPLMELTEVNGAIFGPNSPGPGPCGVAAAVSPWRSGRHPPYSPPRCGSSARWAPRTPPFGPTPRCSGPLTGVVLLPSGAGGPCWRAGPGLDPSRAPQPRASHGSGTGGSYALLVTEWEREKRVNSFSFLHVEAVSNVDWDNKWLITW